MRQRDHPRDGAVPSAGGASANPLGPGQDEPGRSAEREYQRLRAGRQRDIERRWGRLAGVVRAVTDEPQSTRAWKKGAEGQRRLAARLERDLGDTACLLHDRRAPGRRSNLDHIVVGPSGVWVVDAESHRGRIEQRDVGGPFRRDRRLFVGGRDQTALAQAMRGQAATVAAALDRPGVPVQAAVCFVDAEWGLHEPTFQLDQVWVLGPRKLVKLIKAPTALDRNAIADLADWLDLALPPA